MKRYWEKFFNLTVLGKNVDKTVKVLESFGDKIRTKDYRIYDIDGEHVAHFCIIIEDGGKKTFNAIVKALNEQ